MQWMPQVSRLLKRRCWRRNSTRFSTSCSLRGMGAGLPAQHSNYVCWGTRTIGSYSGPLVGMRTHVLRAREYVGW